VQAGFDALRRRRLKTVRATSYISWVNTDDSRNNDGRQTSGWTTFRHCRPTGNISKI